MEEFAIGSGESLPDFSHPPSKGGVLRPEPTGYFICVPCGRRHFLFCITGDPVSAAFPIAEYEPLEGGSPIYP